MKLGLEVSDPHRGTREKPAAARVLLLVPARTYRAADFLRAANRLGLDLVIGSDGALPLGGGPVVRVNPGDLHGSVGRLLDRCGPVDAVVAADTPMLVLAAAVAARMGLAHSPVEAVIAVLKPLVLVKVPNANRLILLPALLA